MALVRHYVTKVCPKKLLSFYFSNNSCEKLTDFNDYYRASYAVRGICHGRAMALSVRECVCVSVCVCIRVSQHGIVSSRRISKTVPDRRIASIKDE